MWCVCVLSRHSVCNVSQLYTVQNIVDIQSAMVLIDTIADSREKEPEKCLQDDSLTSVSQVHGS